MQEMSTNQRKSLLIHTCCAPCLLYPLSVLEEKFDVELLFFNPNIHPEAEYLRRKETLECFSKSKNLRLNLFDEGNIPDDFAEREKLWKSFVPEDRCNYCYATRLEATGKYAQEHKFDYFTTTLLVSIYQKHDKIVEIAKSVAKKYNVNFYYEDFREGFYTGQNLARELGMYRQKYCGCIVSIDESKFKEKILAEHKEIENRLLI